jgi:hypothetical protein
MLHFISEWYTKTRTKRVNDCQMMNSAHGFDCENTLHVHKHRSLVVSNIPVVSVLRRVQYTYIVQYSTGTVMYHAESTINPYKSYCLASRAAADISHM